MKTLKNPIQLGQDVSRPMTQMKVFTHYPGASPERYYTLDKNGIFVHFRHPNSPFPVCSEPLLVRSIKEREREKPEDPGQIVYELHLVGYPHLICFHLDANTLFGSLKQFRKWATNNYLVDDMFDYRHFKEYIRECTREALFKGRVDIVSMDDLYKCSGVGMGVTSVGFA